MIPSQYQQERDDDMQRWHDYQIHGIGVTHERVADWLRKIGTSDEYDVTEIIAPPAHLSDQ